MNSLHIIGAALLFGGIALYIWAQFASVKAIKTRQERAEQDEETNPYIRAAREVH